MARAPAAMIQMLPAIGPAAVRKPAAPAKTGTQQHTRRAVTAPREDSKAPAASTRPGRSRPFAFTDMIIPFSVRFSCPPSRGYLARSGTLVFGLKPSLTFHHGGRSSRQRALIVCDADAKPSSTMEGLAAFSEREEDPKCESVKPLPLSA